MTADQQHDELADRLQVALPIVRKAIAKGDPAGARAIDYRIAFAGLAAAERDELGRLVLATFMDAAAWPEWGWATSRTPWGYLDGAGAELCAGLDDAARARATQKHMQPASDGRRKRLARVAFRMLRTGADGRGLVTRLQAENSQLADPLPADTVDGIALWCAHQHTGATVAR